MALESELSVLQSMDDNELISSRDSRNLGESGTELKINGANRVEDVNNSITVVTPSVTVVSLEDIGSSSSTSLLPAVDKRHGLKKWRRIPRESANKSGDLSVSPVREAMLNVIGDHNVQPVFAVSPDSDLSSRTSVADSPPRTRIGSEKKARGFNIPNENSNSNSTMVFVQGSNTVASRGRQIDSLAKHDEESSDDKDVNEEAQTAFIKSDVESDDDLLVESIKGLHFAQNEFEKEVQKWRDVGKDDSLSVNDPLREILELKDAKILELELALSYGGVKAEIEDCLMKLIQADVENVVITATTERLIEGPLRELKHSLQQKIVLSEDVQTKESLKKPQSSVCGIALCFVIQVILWLVTLYLILAPQNDEVVPT